jgi:hypothetical protein
LNNREVQRDCTLVASDRNLLERSLDRLGLSARAYHASYASHARSRTSAMPSASRRRI